MTLNKLVNNKAFEKFHQWEHCPYEKIQILIPNKYKVYYLLNKGGKVELLPQHHWRNFIDERNRRELKNKFNATSQNQSNNNAFGKLNNRY